jgi:hypothetical protein
MAEKVIAIKVDIQGTTEQQKKLAKLETEVKKLTIRRTELNKAVKNGNISTSKYGAEIAKVNTKLKAYRREMLVTRENILGLDSFTKKLGKSFSRLGTSIGGAVVALFAVQKVGQLFSNALDTIKEFEQQMANVKAITGATASEFAQLEKSAKELGATTQFTATEVGQLQEEYAKLGFTTDQILDASEATLELATATGSDLAQSAKVAAATINGFGLQAKDTQKVVDVMAKSFTSSALDISKFETAMAAVAPVAATVGMSLEETTASLGVLVDAGFDASTAGTALRNILLDTQKAGITTAEAFDKIKASADPSSTALDLFGKRGAAVALTLAKSTSKTSGFTKELLNAQGAAEAMAKVVGDTLEGDIKRLNSAWEGLVLNLGENGEGLFRSIVEGATDFVGVLGDLTKNTHAESDAMRAQLVQVNSLANRIQGLSEKDGNRLKLLHELDAINPDILEGYDKQTISNEELAKAINKANDEMVNRIILQKELEKVQEQAEEVADAAVDVEEIRGELSERLGDRLVRNIELLKEQLDVDDKWYKLKKANQDIAIQENEILKDSNLSVEERAFALSKLAREQNRYGEFTRENDALTVQIRNSTKDLKEEEEKLNVAQDKKAATLERLNIAQEEATEDVDDNTGALNKNNDALGKSIKNYSLLNKEIEELDDDEFFWDDDELDKQEVFFDESGKAVKKFYDFVNKQDEDTTKAQDIEGEARVAGFAEESNRKLALLREELEFKREVRSQELDLAEQTANALVDVSNRRVERQKTLELAALDARLEQGLISQADFEKEREAIERKAFQKQKRLEIAQIQISLARELASIAANSAGNPLNAFTAGTAGFIQNRTLAGLAIARAAVQTGVVASQQFAEGGYTGSGFGSPDSSGFKQAGVVHEGEYVVPKHVLESQRGGQLVGALESMRTNRPAPFSSIGFANGGFTSAPSSVDMTDLENRITQAVTNSIGAIQVVNNATDTVTEAVRVNNIVSEASFG